ncbi:arylesterase [Oleisolibacter albus]|uniref:arylesterase n=1 Tax=Oleisolibacter albus TaxID=2171757 RepID=UPI001EFE1756|nr:arylesterase [Oleisolibacter albus]
MAAFLALSLPGPVLAQGAAGAPADRPLTIVTLGDSLSAGYKLPREAAFTSQLEAALKARGYDVRVPNTGVSGETTAGGLSRLDWLLADKPDMVIVELGANDGLRGIDPAATRANLDRILTRLKEKGVAVLLAGMLAPRNLGPEYARAFDALYPDLAKAHGVAFHPFFLEGVAMDPALNQEDGMHPTAEGVAVIVRNILPGVIAVLDGLKAG